MSSFKKEEQAPQDEWDQLEGVFSVRSVLYHFHVSRSTLMNDIYAGRVAAVQQGKNFIISKKSCFRLYRFKSRLS